MSKYNLLCKHCRKFTIPNSVIEENTHQDGESKFHQFNHRQRSGGNPTVAGFRNAVMQSGCTLIFLEPLKYTELMETHSNQANKEDEHEVEGKICCPQCGYRLGTWSWRGSQCSCGEWMTPAFYVHESKVDKQPVDKNKSTNIVLARMAVPA